MDTSTKDMLYDQSEVNYTTLSSKRNQACANCRFFFPSGACLITENEPLSILATGYCDEWTAQPEPEDEREEMIEVLEAIEQQLGASNMMHGEMEHKATFKERLLALVGIKARDEPLTTSFKAIGNGKWIGIWSNNFEDREREYFSAKATDEYIARLDAKETEMPELRFWHLPYSFGQAKAIARITATDDPYSPSFNIAVGDFAETPAAKAFEKATLKGKKTYRMSHGYMYPTNALIDGVYHYYDTFEVSVLPEYAAANPYTLFGDEQMPISPQKMKELETALDGNKALLADVVAVVERRAKELADEGIGYKDKTIPIVDSEARAQLETLTKEVHSLTEAVKAKMPMMEDDDEEDAKKKKAADESAYRKEVSDAIMTLAKSQTAIVQSVKQITDNLELTPRRASKSADTLVSPDDEALKELQKGMAGEKSNEDKIMYGAFGSILKGVNNGS